MAFAWIPPGRYRMANRDPGALPREVTISRGFWMGKYEVTQEQYRQVTGSHPSKFRSDRHPVERVIWDEARAFCRTLGETAGKTVRLPTNAEWEYACRAGTTTRYHSGDSVGDLAKVAWYKGNSGMRPHSVGKREPNAWGLYDMHGNVREWCRDWAWDDGYPTSARLMDPQGPQDGKNRVLRSGAFWEKASALAVGNANPPDRREAFIGFRVVVTESR